MDTPFATYREMDFSNQVQKGPRNACVDTLIEKIGLDNLSHVFGYGSGVLPQQGYDNVDPQVDVIIIANNTKEFHEKNLKMFPGHYSSLKFLGIDLVERIQQYGAGVYFNPYVPICDSGGQRQMIKYGVLSAKHAMEDVCEWSSMYVAGRLQKPVRHYKEDGLLLAANQFNLSSALNVTLLMLLAAKHGNTISFNQLYRTITLLSYMGDPRMLLGGENPNKVKNIVARQESEFATLYGPFIEEAIEKKYIEQLDEDSFRIQIGFHEKAEMINRLPLQFKRRLLLKHASRDGAILSEEEMPSGLSSDHLVSQLAENDGLHQSLGSAIQTTIRGPALGQTIKGVFTAGLVKSGMYAWEKKLKSWR